MDGDALWRGRGDCCRQAGRPSKDRDGPVAKRGKHGQVRAARKVRMLLESEWRKSRPSTASLEAEAGKQRTFPR